MKKVTFNLDSLPVPEAGFPRAMELEIGKIRILVISGTASVGPNRETMYPGDFEMQVRHTYKNIKDILQHKNFKVKDVVRWCIYLKDITKYYDSFNKIRNEFFEQNGINREDLAPSSCVEAKLCRKDLLVEMEATAVKEESN